MWDVGFELGFELGFGMGFGMGGGMVLFLFFFVWELGFWGLSFRAFELLSLRFGLWVLRLEVRFGVCIYI